MGCNGFPWPQTGRPEHGTRLQRLHGGIDDLMAGHRATRGRRGRRRVGCAVCRLRLAVAQTGMLGIAMMPGVVVMGLMLGTKAMVASGACALHTGRTPSRARQDEREHREQNQYGAGSAAHAGQMIWRWGRIARILKSTTPAPSGGRNPIAAVTGADRHGRDCPPVKPSGTWRVRAAVFRQGQAQQCLRDMAGIARTLLPKRLCPPH